MTKSKKTQKEDNVFVTQLKQALEHFHEPVWLGENSPLAAPYFLGSHLSEEKEPHSNQTRGQVLQQLIEQAHETLSNQPDGDDYSKVIKLMYLEEDAGPINKRLKNAGFSKATFYRKLRLAEVAFAELLLNQLQPALRSEIPQYRHEAIKGRDEIIEVCQNQLSKRRTVGLTGLSGMGKTMLGAYLANSLSTRPFWFTFRPGLNDHLLNLLFALGYFLQQQLIRQQQNSVLFAELAAMSQDPSLEKRERFLAALRHDLEQLAEPLPIFCFDEVDTLRYEEIESHATIIAFLESLIDLSIPIIFMGQQLPLSSPNLDQQPPLTGLPLSEIVALLDEAKIDLTEEDQERLHHYTRGNPRMIRLFITLHELDKPLPELLADLPRTATSLEWLLRRVWQRLAEDEKAVLSQLSVFRSAAPQDKVDQQLLQQLIQRDLVQEDTAGGVNLLPAFRDILYKLLSADQRQQLHRIAATIRRGFGEYTNMAYHFIQADELEKAIWLWHEQRQLEIERGQGPIALRMFEAIPLSRVTDETGKALRQLQAELLKLVGEYDRAQEIFRTTPKDDTILDAQLQRLQGDIAELQSQHDEALHAYQAALTTVENLLHEKVLDHRGVGWTYQLQKNNNKAWNEAQIARFEAENLQGYVQMQMGNYKVALDYFSSALALVEKMDYKEGVAKIHDNLGQVLTFLKRYDEAEQYFKKSLEIHQKISRQTRIAGVCNNLVWLYNEWRKPNQAIEYAEKSLPLFERSKEDRGIALACLNLAEAHLGLSNLDEAEKFVYRIYHMEMPEMPELKGDSYRLLGRIRFEQGNIEEAKSLVQQAIQAAKDIGDDYGKDKAIEEFGFSLT